MPALCALVTLFSLFTASANAAEWSLLPAAYADEQEGPTASMAEPETYLRQPSSGQMRWEDPYYVDCPRWTFWAGAIFLQRNNPGNQALVVDPGANQLLNAQQLDFGTGAGVDINAIRHGEAFDIGFRYFQVNGMSAHQQLFPSGSSTLPIFNPFSFLTPRLDAYGLTQLQSVEINLRRNMTERFTVLAGFRYLALDDNLRHQFDILSDSFSVYRYNVDAINRMYGGQVGVDAILFSRGRFQLETVAKAGIYGNAARNALQVSVFELPNVVVGRHAGQTSFVGDWNFSGIVQITDHLAIRAGYQLLWLSGVALSTEQFPFVSTSQSSALHVVTNGDLFLHGAMVSVQATW